VEKVVVKRSLKDFRNKENPWKSRTPLERLEAMAVICQTQQSDNDQSQSGLSRVYRITRK
jgi:hypothetical protein